MIRALFMVSLVFYGTSYGSLCDYHNKVLISGGVNGDVDGTYYPKYYGDRSVKYLVNYRQF